jgi:hypothetical protein
MATIRVTEKTTKLEWYKIQHVIHAFTDPFAKNK